MTLHVTPQSKKPCEVTAPAAIIETLGDPLILTSIAALLIQIGARYLIVDLPTRELEKTVFVTLFHHSRLSNIMYVHF